MPRCGILSCPTWRGGFYLQLASGDFPSPRLFCGFRLRGFMGTQGLRAGVKGGGSRIRFFHVCVAAFGLLPLLGGCSSSSSPVGVATQPAVVGTGYGTAINDPSPPDGSGPSGLLVDLMGPKPAPRALAAAPSQPSSATLDGYVLAAQMPAVAPPLNNPVGTPA